MTRESTTIGESERWLSVIVGGMLALSSLRRRDLGAGALFALGGAALIFRGLVGHDGLLRVAGGSLRGEIGRGARAAPSAAGDEVEEASMESFPASDPPSWTPTSGSEAGSGSGAGGEAGDAEEPASGKDEG